MPIPPAATGGSARPELVAAARVCLDAGGTLDDAAGVALARTQSPIDVIKALRAAQPGLSLPDAKAIVHRNLSPPVRAAHEQLWSELVAGLASRASIEVDQFGAPARREASGLSDEEVIALLSAAAAAPDTNIKIRKEGREGQLMIALDQAKVFIGMQYLDGVFQFAADDSPQEGLAGMNIGGSAVDLAARYVTTLPVLVEVTRSWLAGEDAVRGFWERQ
jgi:hypothetical protein